MLSFNVINKYTLFKPSHCLLIRLWPLGSNQGFGALIHKEYLVEAPLAVIS